MSVKDLVSKFTWTYKLPIEVSQVVAEMRKLGVNDEINFWRDTNLSGSIIKGFITRWVREDEDGNRAYVSDITFAAGDPASERLTVCKELMHIFDPENARVRSEEELVHQIGRIVLPPHLSTEFMNETSHVRVDKVGEIMATTVLFPFNARMALAARFKSGEVSLEQIAERAKIPLINAALVMNESWLFMHRLLLPGNNR